MMTPQQLQQITFSKAVFGGYDMQQVDDVLEPLMQDYLTLYKENATLKAKMKILVEKFEQLREEKSEPKDVLAETQAKCDAMIAEAQRKCDEIAQSGKKSGEQEIAEETERLNCAKQTALNFIEVIEHDIQGHLKLLETLKTRDLKLDEQSAQRAKAFDWQRFEPVAPSQSPKDIASEISENLEKLVGEKQEIQPFKAPDYADTGSYHPESTTLKFNNLKFGKNYDPTQDK